MMNSPLASVAATRNVLDEHGLSTKKSLGQHFLVNDAVVGRICDLADIAAGDAVVEVGPGIGTLTCALLARGARVVAVERDGDLLPVLEDTCKGYETVFQVLNADALKVGESDLPFSPGKFVANLPYAVAATLVLDFFERFGSLTQATVMVQSEVAARMMARPGTKDYGAYTVKLGLFAAAVGSFKVSPGNFFPPPHVDSTVIRLDRAEQPGVSAMEARAAAIMADAAFANRRKTISNSCKTYFAGNAAMRDALADLFSDCGIDPACRGETLALEDYVSLGKAACAAGVL